MVELSALKTAFHVFAVVSVFSDFCPELHV